MANKKLQQSTFKEVVDLQTGEVVTMEQTKTFIKEIKSDAFYMTFIDYISPFFNLRTDTAKSVLAWLCASAEFNTGKVKLTTEDRKQLCKILDISPNSLTNNLKILKDNNLISGERGNFLINPQVHWKGDTKTRDKLLTNNEIKITFSI